MSFVPPPSVAAANRVSGAGRTRGSGAAAENTRRSTYRGCRPRSSSAGTVEASIASRATNRCGAADTSA